MTTVNDDWPRDVLVDLMMHLSRAGYGRSAEHLADALIVFETERSQRRLADGAAPTKPVFQVIAGKGTAA